MELTDKTKTKIVSKTEDKNCYFFSTLIFIFIFITLYCECRQNIVYDGEINEIIIYVGTL